MRFQTFAIVTGALAPAAFAGDVLVVSSFGPHTTIQSAIDAADAYDTILVRYNVSPGYYPGFTIGGKSLAVVAKPDVFPLVVGEARVQTVSAGKLAVISGLEIRGNSSTTYALRLLGNGGAVRVQDCKLTGFSSDCVAGPSVWVGTDSDPQFVDTSIWGGAPLCGQFLGVVSGKTALFSRSPMLQIFGGLIQGGDGSYMFEDDAWPGGAGAGGLEVPDGVTLLVGTNVKGGKGGNGDYESHFDCSAGGAGGAGGAGVIVGSSPPSSATPNVSARGGSVAGGNGGIGGGSECGPNGPNGPAGAATVVHNGSWTPLAGVARFLGGDAVARENDTATLVATGAPGDRVYVTIEDAATNAPLVVASTTHLPMRAQVKSLGTIGPSGTLTATLPVGFLTPGTQSQWWRIESLFVDSTGARHVGNEFVLVIIDSALW